jgi:preprotein translocase subunit YajC
LRAGAQTLPDTIAGRLRPSSAPQDHKDPPVFISEARAQTAPAATAADSPLTGLTGMLPLVLIFVVAYFFMIRPQMRRQKEAKALVEALAKGDEVVTAGGLLGRVTRLGESFLHMEVASGVEIQIQRTAVVQVLPKGSFK